MGSSLRRVGAAPLSAPPASQPLASDNHPSSPSTTIDPHAHTRTHSIHSHAPPQTRTALSRSDGEMLVKLRLTDSFLSSFTSARSAGKRLLRCAQPGTRRSWNKGNTGGRGRKKKKQKQEGGRFSCEDDWLVTKKTGSPFGFGCYHPLELDGRRFGGPACSSHLDGQRFFVIIIFGGEPCLSGGVMLRHKTHFWE